MTKRSRTPDIPFPFQIDVGEMEFTTVYWFEALSDKQVGVVDLSRRVRAELGEDAARWLLHRTRGEWSFTETTELLDDGACLVKARNLGFEDLDDAVDFNDKFWTVLQKASLSDLVSRITWDSALLGVAVYDLYYDPSRLSLDVAVERFEEALVELNDVRDRLDEISDLSEKLGRPNPFSIHWIWMVKDAEIIPLPKRAHIDSGDPEAYLTLLAELKKDIQVGRFDLSPIEAEEWIPTIREFLQRSKRLKSVWRTENRRRIDNGRNRLKRPF